MRVNLVKMERVRRSCVRSIGAKHRFFWQLSIQYSVPLRAHNGPTIPIKNNPVKLNWQAPRFHWQDRHHPIFFANPCKWFVVLVSEMQFGPF
jgi:hypothetical protein